MKRIPITLGILIALALGAAVAARSAVNIEWRPGYQAVNAGDVLEVGLYAVSDNGDLHPISAMDVIMLCDTAYLSFQNLTPEGEQYDWFDDGFMSPSPDGLNNALGDGDMIYTALAQLGVPAQITARGMRVTTLVFEAQLPVCRTLISLPESYGTQAVTRVLDGTIPNLDVKGTLGSARIMIVPLGYLTSVAQAKQELDETYVELAGPIVTRSFASGTYFYVEDYNRTAGIRVNCDPLQLPAEGATPTIQGTIRTVNGERVIDSIDVTVGTGCLQEEIPGPFGLVVRAIHQNMLPQGLLVRVSGRVTSGGGNTFVLDDASPLGLTVELHSLSLPANGDFVAVTGTVGADAFGPVLRVNDSSDIQLIPE